MGALCPSDFIRLVFLLFHGFRVYLHLLRSSGFHAFHDLDGAYRRAVSFVSLPGMFRQVSTNERKKARSKLARFLFSGVARHRHLLEMLLEPLDRLQEGVFLCVQGDAVFGVSTNGEAVLDA